MGRAWGGHETGKRFIYSLETSFYKWSGRDIIGMVSHNHIWERPAVLIKTDSLSTHL